MKKSVFLLCLIFVFSLFSCSPEPRPIEYGRDNCSLCEMTIMDRRYGAEMVTRKGKVYTFDSIECLVDYLQDHLTEGEEAGFVLVTSYDEPNQLTDATGAWYIHTRHLPSPMGMYLTAFDSEMKVREARKEHGGLVFSWEELLQEFNNLHPSLLKH